MVSCSGFESFTLIGDEFVLKLSPSNYTFANIDLIIVKSKQRQFVFGSGWSGLRVPALEEKDLPTDPTIFNGIHFRCGTDTFPIETTFELKNSMVHSKWFYCNIPCLESCIDRLLN